VMRCRHRLEQLQDEGHGAQALQESHVRGAGAWREVKDGYGL
jgi:hypothetical protein